MKKLIITKVILFFAVTLLFLFQVTSAQALNSPTKISTSPNDNLAPAIVADSNGKVHIVWMDAPGGWFGSEGSLVHSYWNGSIWSTPATITSTNFPWLPSLAADAGGDIHLTFGTLNESPTKIYYSKYNGTSWSTPVVISNPTPGDDVWDSEITVDSLGNPHVVYTSIPAGTVGNERFTYYTRWNGSSWTTPVNITESGTFHQFPTLAADSAGKVHVVWKNTAADNSSYEILHRVWTGGSFGPTNSIAGVINLINDAEPRVAVDKANNAHVVWEERVNPLLADYNIKYSKWNGTSWSTPFLISSVGQETTQGLPSVAVLPSSIDDVLIGWIDKSSSPFKVGFRKYNASNGQWEVARTNSIDQTSADFPVAAMDKWDNIHVAWGEVNATTSRYDLYYDAIPLAVAQIGPSGGTLTTFNGDTLTIPSGSLAQDTLISAQIAPLSQPPPGDSASVPRQYIFEPTGTVFNPALTAVFKYTDAELGGADESTLGIYVWDSQTSTWVFKTGKINKAQNKLTVQLDHFSIYGLFATNDSATWISPLREDGPNEFSQGRTLPIKFKSNEEIDEPNQMKVQILNDWAHLIKEFSLGTGSDDLRYDPLTKQYIASLDTKPMKTGTYQINLLYKGLLKDSLEFSLK